MKFLTVFLLLFNCIKLCYAQGDVLSIDEQGKLIYYEAVTTKGLDKYVISDRIKAYFKQENLKYTCLNDTSFLANGKLIIQKTVLVLSHPSGEVLYHLNIEVKEERYRFWLTDFTFIPYQRDRYGNFVPSSSKGIALESDQSKLNASQWKEYQDQTAKHATQFATIFKEFVRGQMSPLTFPKEKTVIKKDWEE